MKAKKKNVFMSVALLGTIVSAPLVLTKDVSGSSSSSGKSASLQTTNIRDNSYGEMKKVNIDKSFLIKVKNSGSVPER